MTLKEQLDRHKANFISRVPPETLEIMRRATDDLRKSGIMDSVVKVGDRAPDFTLPNAQGDMVSLKDLTERGPLVITFYRGVW